MNKPPAPRAPSAAVAAFLEQAARVPALRPSPATIARLIFAIDATASRERSWDQAAGLTAEMLQAAQGIGGLAISLAYYRGFGEFRATPFLQDAQDLARRLSGVACLGGKTQIQAVLDHALAETKQDRIRALIFIGDAMEENADTLCHIAGELGLRGTPIFVFHEGADPVAGAVFRQIARLSGGAYLPFDSAAIAMLRDLLRAIAVFAAGGRSALAQLPGAAARQVAGLLPKPQAGT
jgi:Mg-chelatase subunit ChlD